MPRSVRPVAGISDAQLAELETRGFVRVPAGVSSADAAAMEERVWAWLAERDGVDRNDRSTWPVEVKKLQPLRKAAVFNGFVNAQTSEIVNGLLGPGWHQFGIGPQALLSFPTDRSWDLPHKMWHFDLPARGPVSGFSALRCLGFVNDVGPRGGGTLVVEGSHELGRVAPWFAALLMPGGDRVNRFMLEGDTVHGDNISMNVADRPRMMTSFSFFDADYQPFAATADP